MSRHSYLERLDPSDGWQALMTSNEVCLHNPDTRPRTYSVVRRHMPVGFGFEADGPVSARKAPLEVTVPAGGNRVVRVSAPGARMLTPGRPCTMQSTEARIATA